MTFFIGAPVAAASYRKLVVDATASNQTATATLATLAVPAGVVTSYIIINVNMSVEANTSSGASEVKLLIDTGVTNRLTRQVGYTLSPTDLLYGCDQTFYYEPTAGEKSAGFNVVIKETISGAGGQYKLNYYSTTVMGM